METSKPLPVTADDLKRRFLRACELTQVVNWEKIVECLQQWMAVMKIEAAPIVRIESVEQYLKALRIGSAAKQACRPRAPNGPLAAWAIRAMRETSVAMESKAVKAMIKSAPLLTAARNTVLKSPMFAAGTATVTRFPRDTTASMNMPWLSIIAIGAAEFGNGPEFLKWYPLFEAFEAGAYRFFFTERCVEVCPVPHIVRVDAHNRLHSEAGPAFVWLSDVRDFYWHGVKVASYVVENPEQITVADIEVEPNAEVRRVKIERMGHANPHEKMPHISSVAADELKERFIRACELKQTVNWEKIVHYFLRWAAGLEMDVSAIVRIENSDQFKKSASAARKTKSASPEVIANALAQRAGIDPWEHRALMLEGQARSVRQYLSLSAKSISGAKAKELVVLAEEIERLAVIERGRNAASAARIATAVWTAKVAEAAIATANVGNANILFNGRVAWAGSEAWDVPLRSISAIEALEQTCQGTQFSSWYQIFKAFEAGAFCFFITDRCIEVCPIPSVATMDALGRLHSASGPAFVWLNDVRDFYWHGVRVESYVVDNPERITVLDIEAESNAEVRRVKIERFGQERYLTESGAREIHRDDYGTLFRKEMRGDEALVMVKVVNATPEPDGSFKDYFLRVPPTVLTAREAVAWTFGKTSDGYEPVKET
jgi:hypothetical protein